ncbi:MAG: AAA family ATPase [Paludibacteraceae bacterium]|nr:AAA family ATPase [Paludibacteraceae bacterium]
MKLSVGGFKSIVQVDNFNLAPLTMLAGINSSGKTSLLQALLLLKQTVESESKQVLLNNGKYLNAENVTDLMFKKPGKKEMSIGIILSEEEVANPEDFVKYSEGSDVTLSTVETNISFITESGECFVKGIEVVFRYSDDSEQSVKIKRLSKLYNISYSSSLMIDTNTTERNDKRTVSDASLEFTNFLPFYGEAKVGNTKRIYSLPVMKELMTTLKSYFSKLKYVGPSRVEPELSRSYSTTLFESVGVNGEYTRFILNEKKNEVVDGYEETLTQAVSRWICREMNLAKSIDVVKDANRLYRTFITNHSGIKVDLCQMGFGLSQILPVVVQGLLTPKGGMFIVVDPDVHIHPKVQGVLVDFFIELKNHGRTVIVETHSDHLITRLRRRVAERKVDNNDVNLCFVTNVNGVSNYVSYALDPTGAFTTKLPVDFMDALDDDYRAIVQAKFQQGD